MTCVTCFFFSLLYNDIPFLFFLRWLTVEFSMWIFVKSVLSMIKLQC